jgi:hypothetical protein
MIRIRRDKVPGGTSVPRAPHAPADIVIAQLLQILIQVRGEEDAARDIVRGLLRAIADRAPPFEDATDEECAALEAALKGRRRGPGSG